MSPPKYTISVSLAVQVADIGLINHLGHIGGGELSIIKVRFDFYPTNTQ